MNVTTRDEYNRPTHEYNNVADELRWEAGGRRRPSEADRLQLAPVRKEARVRERTKARSGFVSTVVIALMIFGAFSFLVYRYQAVYADEMKINEMESRIEELTRENEKLETQIAVSEDIEEVRARASGELNMDFPDSGNLRKVELREAIKPVTQDKGTEAKGGADFLALVKSFFE